MRIHGWILPGLLAASAIAASAHADPIYVYEIISRNIALNHPEGTQDGITLRLRQFLFDHQYHGDCIDLRTLDAQTSGNLGLESRESFVLNRELTRAHRKALTQYLCGDSTGCTVEVPAPKIFPSELLVMTADLVSRGPETLTTYQQRLDPKKKLPNFSESCFTGKNQDSITDTAATPGARDLLARWKWPRNLLKRLTLTGAENQKVWAMGEVRPDEIGLSAKGFGRDAPASSAGEAK